MKFEVIKDIPEDMAWETSVKLGDVLYVGKWEGFNTLMKDGKAVCDLGSIVEKEYCREVLQ